MIQNDDNTKLVINHKQGRGILNTKLAEIRVVYKTTTRISRAVL
jgi:hypothetical protein